MRARFATHVWRRSWRHEGGAEAIEIVALVAVCLTLLAVIGLAFNAQGVNLGAAAIGTLTRFASEQAPRVEGIPMDRPDVQGPAISPITAPAMGIPRIVIQPPRMTGPNQTQRSAYQPDQQGSAWQGSGNPLLDFWNSLADWVKGAVLGLAGAAVAVVGFLGLVAVGVITVASGAVLAAIAAVALAVGAIAGAIYVLATGKVDVLQTMLVGFFTALTAIVAMLNFPAIAAFFRSIAGQVAAFWSQRIVPFLLRIWNGIKTGWRWFWRNLDTKFRPLPIPFEIKITDVISNLIKLFGFAAFFKEIWVAGNQLPLWQWIGFAFFAVISAYVPAGGIARILVKAIYDFVAVWITGGVKFVDSFIKRFRGINAPSTPQPTPTPQPAPGQSPPSHP